jgi:hypothetical protein
MDTFDAHGLAYDACDIPAGMTIAQFRARRPATRTGVLRRLRRAVRVARMRR